jgi:hypothetical protein
MQAPRIYQSELDLIFKQGPNNFKPARFHPYLNLRSWTGQNIKTVAHEKIMRTAKKGKGKGKDLPRTGHEGPEGE